MVGLAKSQKNNICLVLINYLYFYLKIKIYYKSIKI